MNVKRHGLSIGIERTDDDFFLSLKAIGKLKNLREKTKNYHTDGFGISIGHTRWATHGKPTELNAHPHLGAYSYVVHNGIIENYQDLKAELQADGVTFLSQTDTETIVHLFEKNKIIAALLRDGLMRASRSNLTDTVPKMTLHPGDCC